MPLPAQTLCFRQGVPNSCPNFGESFVDYWGRLWVCLLGFTLRPTVRLSGPTRISRGCCDVWSLRIPLPGVSNFHGLTYAHNSLQVSSTGLSPFECSLGYQPPLFPSMESEVRGPLCSRLRPEVSPYLDESPRDFSSGWGACTKAKADRHRSKPPVYVVGQKVLAFYPEHSAPVRCVISWIPNLLAHFLSPRLLVRWQSASTPSCVQENSSQRPCFQN